MPPMVSKNKICIGNPMLDDTGRNQSRWVVISIWHMATNDKPIHYMIASSAPKRIVSNNQARQSESARDREHIFKNDFDFI